MSNLPKAKRDWRALDAAHQKRGAMLTIWLDASNEAFAPPAKTGRRGRPSKFSDAFIEAALTVKVLTGLPLRAVEGFVRGVRDLAGAQWPVPDHSTLSLRQASLDVNLEALTRSKRRVLMVDSTGLKVFGEGEWKVRQHGTEGKRRTWRKMHLLVDRETGQVVAVETTDNGRGSADPLILPALLPEDLEGDFVLGDGAYHTKKLHREVYARHGTLMSPPKEGCRRWGKTPTHNDEAAFVFRNSQVRAIKALGRKPWKLRSGMSRRSYVESMMHRFKSLTGPRLAARTFARQKVEVRLRCKVLNKLAVSTATVTA